MPFCPQCRDEFQDWVQVCPDCGEVLLDELPALPEPQPEDDRVRQELSDEPLVHIATAPSVSIAKMWAGILEQEGIPSLTKGGSLYLFPLDSCCEIHVLASQAEKARQILTPFLEDS